MKEVVIVGAGRSPIGSFGGALSSLSAVELAVQVTNGVFDKFGIKRELVQDVLYGNVLSAGLGQNPARQIALKSGLNENTTAMSINILCGSGLRSVSLGVQTILCGDSDVVLVGGTESMSNSPYILPKARWGFKMGSGELQDSLIEDGLTDAFNDYHMGITAENIAERWEITRAEQDEFALQSQLKAEKAQKESRFKNEIIPISIKGRKGSIQIMDEDEYPKHGMAIEKLSKLKPAFKKDGTVTAGNASGINDGAASLVLMSKEKAEEYKLKPLGKIISYATTALDPEIMGYGPVEASKKALLKAKLTIEDMDVIEANEAFASQSIAVTRDLNIPSEKVNVNGGAIALGHPIGASGARILTTLLFEMEKRNIRYGLATLCIGGGQGTAVIIEREVE